MAKNGSGKVIVPYATIEDMQPLPENELDFLGRLGNELLNYVNFSWTVDYRPCEKKRPLLVRYPSIKSYRADLYPPKSSIEDIVFPPVQRLVYITPFKKQDKINGIYPSAEFLANFTPLYWGAGGMSYYIFKSSSLVCVDTINYGTETEYQKLKCKKF